MVRAKWLGAGAALVVAVSSQAVRADLGTTWVDFGGGANLTFYPDSSGNPGNTFGAFSLMDGATSLFGTLTDATDKAAVEAAIVAKLNADYAGLGITFTTTQPASGSYNRLVIGNPQSGDDPGLFGQADAIDFRNKTADNVVGVSVTAHAAHAAPGAGWSIDNVAQVIANTAAHELGHALGLVHSDVVSTFADTAGTNAQKSAAVQSGELMTKDPTDASFFGALSFGRFSKTLLDISANGINVETESGVATFTLPTAADPARAGDAGDTLATATTLKFDSKGRVTVLGAMGADDIDIFKFSGSAGDKVTAEVLSATLSSRLADTISGLKIELLDDTGAVIVTVDARSSNINGGEFDGQTGADIESRSLLFEYVLPGNATHTYGLRLTADGADLTGSYELLVMIPEPATMAMLVLSSVILLRRRIA